MVRDCGVHYSKYTVGHIHVVKVGWSTFDKSENIGTLPNSSGFIVRTGYMLKIATLHIDIFLRLCSLAYEQALSCSTTCWNIDPLPHFFQILPTKGLHAAHFFRRIGTFPHFVCITVRQGPTLPRWLNMPVRPLPIFFQLCDSTGFCWSNVLHD